MGERWNELQWRGQPGHYEVYYLTFTDPGTGVGIWIRYTMVAPLAETGEEATCSLWFMAMDPSDPGANVGSKVSLRLTAGLLRPISRASVDGRHALTLRRAVHARGCACLRLRDRRAAGRDHQ